MLVIAAQRVGWKLDEMEFEPATFRRHLSSREPRAIYAHVNQDQSESVRKLLNQIGKKVGGSPIPPGMNVQNNTVIVGPKFLVTLRANETSIDYLTAVLDPSQLDTRCFLCGAPSRYIDPIVTRQCMRCVARICRACVAYQIHERVERFTDIAAAQRMSGTELDDMFCPCCPSCDDLRVGDLPVVRAKIIDKCRQARTKIV